MEKVRFGIIGCGAIAPFHARALHNIDGAELVACCDIIEERAENFRAEFGAQRIYIDYNKMLKCMDIDAVCICTPSGLHGEMAIAAVNAGKHVLCEKPMEINAQKLKAVVDAVKKSKSKMACVLQRRWQPTVKKVKQALDSGEFGKVLVADAYLKYYRSPEYYKSAGWRATWEFDGGGALMNQGIHGIDLIAWLMGGVKSVYAVTRTQLHDIEVEDTALCVVKYNNGSVGVIEGTTCVYPAQETRFDIHCENGSIIFADSGIIEWKKKGEESAEIEKGLNDSFSAKDNPTALGNLTHDPVVQDLVDAILNDKPPAIEPSEGRKAVDIILAIYESGKTGKEVILEEMK